MADNSLRQRADFPELRDKILSGLEISSDSEYFGITLSFQDNTTFTLEIEPCVAVFPVLSEWHNREETSVKKYEPFRSSEYPRD